MDKAHEVLVRVAEAHATAYTTLEEGGRTREVERNHALVLVPDVDHAVEACIATAQYETVEQLVPHLVQLVESSIDGLDGRKFLDGLERLALVDQCHIAILRRDERALLLALNILNRELLVLLVLDIAKQEDEVLRFARLERYFDVMTCNG